MHLIFRNNTLEKECIDFNKATKSYGHNCAKILHRRIRELKSADSIEEMVAYNIGRCHALKGDLSGKYALDLEHPFRLIIESIEGSSNILGIKIVKLVEVTDYHGN